MTQCTDSVYFQNILPSKINYVQSMFHITSTHSVGIQPMLLSIKLAKISQELLFSSYCHIIALRCMCNIKKHYFPLDLLTNSHEPQ